MRGLPGDRSARAHAHAWGHNGRVPEQLAQAILCKVTSQKQAQALCRIFTREVIACLPYSQDFRIPVLDVSRWLENKRKEIIHAL